MNDIFENTETMKENEHPRFYTAESVMRGHPDKLCDLIADSVLDACLQHDPASRVACEVMATHGHIIVAGEITTSAKPDVFNMDLNKYLNETAAPETQYSKEEYAAMKKAEREAVWVQVDARIGEVLADAPALQEFLNFMSQSRNSLPNQLLLSGQNADITDARTFQQWKDAGRHIRTGEEGYTAIVGQVYENNGRKASGYNIGKVFDITQTRGRPVPPPAEYQVDELIAAAIESSPVPIQISDSLPDGIQAQYVPKNRTIYVRNGMDGTTNWRRFGHC